MSERDDISATTFFAHGTLWRWCRLKKILLYVGTCPRPSSAPILS